MIPLPGEKEQKDKQWSTKQYTDFSTFLFKMSVPDECLCTWWMFVYLMNVCVPDECFCTWWMFLYLMNVCVPDECFCTWW
jgi:hypothetical protein